MANWNCNDGFKNQKKRTFIYKSAPQTKTSGANPQKIERSLPSLQMTNVSSYSSPRKKLRSSYSYYDKSRSDQKAAEELCSDLPLDAFEDGFLDDFGDDFSAEELCQVAEQTEQQVLTQSISKVTKPANNLPKQNVQNNGNGFEEDYFGDFDQDLDLADSESLLTNNGYNQSHFSIPSKENTMKLADIPSEKTAILFSAESPSDNQTHYSFTNGVTAASNKFKAGQKTTEDLQLLQEKLIQTENRIKELEELNYSKDGNLKMLQDSLEHLRSEEIKHKEKLRNVEELKRTELKELHKNHAKTVEQLNSKICFQEQEIKQAKEYRQAKLHESNMESPKTSKPHKLSANSVIPIGQSFFEKSGTESRSPNLKKLPKVQKSPEKIPLESSSTKEEIPKRTLEKQSLRAKDVSSKTTNVEVVQRLFKLNNTELTGVCTRHETSPLNQSLLSLLRLNLNATTSELGQMEDGISLHNALVDQEFLSTATLSSEFKSREVCKAIEGIQELINTNQFTSKTDGINLKLVNNFKASDILDSSQILKSAVNLLPLLECHISRYAELRVDKDEDSFLSTCPPSPLGDLSDLKDKDSIAALSLAFDTAVQSLRCLAVLVSCSDEVCEVLLKAAKTAKVEKENVQGSETVQNNANTSSEMVPDDKCDLLSLLFQLAVPQPNEPPLVSLVSLGVIEALANNCPQQYITWFLPRLCDTLLPQCLSKEYCLSTLSVVVAILMTSLCGRHVCSQSDDCVLLKVYQGCLSDSVDLPHANKISLQSKIVVLVDNITSSNNEALPHLVDCHCTVELLKLLVCLLHKEMVFLEQYPPESLMNNINTSLSLHLLHLGISLLASLATFSKLLFADLSMLVGHKYNSLVIGTVRLMKEIPGLKNNLEKEVLMDLLDMDNIEYTDVVEDDEGSEEMEVDE